MKFGVCLPQYGREVSFEDLHAVATDAEALGFDSVWASDHIVTPEHMHRNIGPIFVDAFVLLSHVSAMTTSGQARHDRSGNAHTEIPLVAAKMISSLDALSGGRVILGVGAGGAPDEFAALGSPGVPAGRPHRRIPVGDGRVVDQRILPVFRGGSCTFEEVQIRAQSRCRTPHPPIWVGGRSDAALRRRAVTVRRGVASHTSMPTGRPAEKEWNAVGRNLRRSRDAP